MSDVADRREAITAAVEAYNYAHPASPLPRPAARLLAVMFDTEDVCCVSQQALAADGFNGKSLPAVLRALVDAGIVLRQAGTSRIPDTIILGPSLGQIQPSVDQRLAQTARIAQEHADLAVFHPSRSARILPRNTNRIPALLEKARLTDHQHAVPMAQAGNHLTAYQIAQRIRIPTAPP
jgi:hypothetical protein